MVSTNGIQLIWVKWRRWGKDIQFDEKPQKPGKYVTFVVGESFFLLPNLFFLFFLLYVGQTRGVICKYTGEQAKKKKNWKVGVSPNRCSTNLVGICYGFSDECFFFSFEKEHVWASTCQIPLGYYFFSSWFSLLNV